MTQEGNREVFSPASVQDPSHWNDVWNELRSSAVSSCHQVVLTHDAASPLNSNSLKARLTCSVRTLPRLNEVKSALRRMLSLHEKCPESIPAEFPSADVLRHDGARDFQVPNPTIWAVEASVGGDVTVTDALEGVVLMRISGLKSNVLVTSIMHAPFRGFIDRHQEIVPIKKPQDILSVRETALVVTDYVWVGFADGAIRLFPADPQRVREQDRSVLLARGDIADLVYELPKNHNSAIVSISRSPCHEDDKTTDLVTANRLSSALRELTAATSCELGNTREHLSLVCTASEDSCIVVWDLRKIYRRLEEMRVQSQESSKKCFVTEPTSRVNIGDVVTFEMLNPRVVVCSSCTMVKVRPLFKLKGSVSGLRTLNWITTNVTTVNYQKPRDVVAMTRDPKNSDTSTAVRNRRAFQQSTQRERREEHRLMLRLTELDMQEVEDELALLMPPIAPEPPQSRRINLIVAGDANGVVHMWDLDEELRWKTNTADMPLRALDSCSTPMSTARLSPPRSYNRNEPSSHEVRGLQTPCRGPQQNQSSEEPQMVLHIQSPVFQRHEEAREKPRHQKEKKKNLVVQSQLKRSFLRGSQSVTSPKQMTSSTASGNLVRRGRLSKNSFSTSSSTYTQTKKTLYKRNTVDLPLGGTDGSARTIPHLLSNSRLTATLTMGASPGSCVKSAAKGFAHPVSSEHHNSTSKRVTASTPTTTGALSIDALGTTTCSAHQRNSRRTLENFSLNSASYRTTHNASQVASPYLPEPALRRSLPRASQQTPRRAFPRASQRELQVASPNDLRHSARKVLPHGVEQSAQKQPQQYLQRGGNPVASPANKETWTVKWGSSRDTCAPTSPPRSPCAQAPSNSSSCPRTAGDWLTGHARLNNLYCRDAKCRMELTDGAAVSGIAVVLPPVVVVTMRQLPDPEERPYSLLEQMPEEEVCRRRLANTFYDLTDDRALYCAFERLQFFLAVDGTVMSIQCKPKFMKSEESVGPSRIIPTHHAANSSERMTEESPPLSFRPSYPHCSFRVVFRRHVLERHSQPISMFFVDHPRRQLWVARHDGLFSIFSTLTGAILTRLPHPSAAAALGPPNAIEWRRQQRSMALREGRSVHLEIHRECRGFPPAYFINAMPVTVMQQFALLRLAVSGVLEPGADNEVEIVKMDGRTAFDACGRGREASLARLLNSLKQYRRGAVAVAEAQRDSYHSLCSLLVYRVTLLVGHCASLTVLHAARRAFRAWRAHCKYFTREFVLRRMRKTRIRKLAHAANFASLLSYNKLTRLYYDRWRTVVRMLRVGQSEIRLARVLGIGKCPDIYTRLINFLADYFQHRRYWILWRSINVPTPVQTRTHGSPRMISPRAASGSLSPRRANVAGIMDTYSPRSPRMGYASSSRTRWEDRDGVFADFNSIVCCIHSYRDNLIRFRFDENRDTVLDIDDLWVDTIETAAAEADAKTPYAYKLAVFKFSLLPLLDGMLSTAEEVLPHIQNYDVSDEIRSLIRASLQSIDYIYADPEFFVVSVRNTDSVHTRPVHDVAEPKKESPHLSRDSEMRALFEETMDEARFRMQIECITSQRRVIHEFLRICCTF